jgi:alanine dehydrogenase
MTPRLSLSPLPYQGMDPGELDIQLFEFASFFYSTPPHSRLLPAYHIPITSNYHPPSFHLLSPQPTRYPPESALGRLQIPLPSSIPPRLTLPETCDNIHYDSLRSLHSTRKHQKDHILNQKLGQTFTLGLPRMHKESGERRDFMPKFVARLHKLGANLLLEHDYGAGMGFNQSDYLNSGNSIRFASHAEIYHQDNVLVLRCPSDDEIRLMRPGACLISMLHYPTRPQRVELLRSLGLEAISLDSLKDDSGRRLVENLRAVGWNGMQAAFETLRAIYPQPGFDHPHRPPIRVTLLGAGAVGTHVFQAAIRYGNEELRTRLAAAAVPGVQVTAVDYDLTGFEPYMAALLKHTDILVDATQRPDPARVVIPNSWIAHLPEHAVLLDLSVDPYDCSPEARSLKGIEGIPQGNLDKYIFSPDDPAYTEIPPCVNITHRRHAVSCYSWPGIHPRQCMAVYGKQIQPVIRVLIEKGGAANINPKGKFFERTITRAQLSRWDETRPAV